MMEENAVLIPREVFVGDIAEYRIQIESAVPCSFSSNEKIIEELFFDCADDVEILSMQIEVQESKNTNNSFLVLKLVPWKTGEINFPEIPAGSIPENSFLKSIQIPSITVSSITEKTETEAIQNSMPPIVIPGTTYIIYVGFFSFILLITLITICTLKFTNLRNFFSMIISKKIYSRNYRKTRRELLKLKKQTQVDEIDYKTFSTKVQHILRNYFSKHFETDVRPASTDEIKTFAKIFFEQNQKYDYEKISVELKNEMNKSINNVFNFFSKTDFYRYAKISKRNELDELDMNSLIDEAIDLIERFEKIAISKEVNDASI